MLPIYAQDGTTIIGYSYTNGYAIWTYSTSWQAQGITLDAAAISSGALTPVVTNSVTTGYTYIDTFGTTYTYSVDANGAVTGYTSTYSGVGYSYTYNFDALGGFNGYSHFDGTTTTTYDANWNVISTVTVIPSNMVAILDGSGATIGYSVTDEWGTTTNYALDHVTVTGYSYTYVDTWNNTTSVSSYDANWNYLGSETQDAQGNVLYSNSYSYDANGNFTGYTYFDGVTTTVYDANWNVVSSTASTANLTAVLDANGATIGYTYTDQWGTTTTYDLNGLVTGYRYTYVDTWNNTTSVTTYDANWNYLGSETQDAQGNVLYSNSYSYDANGNFTGYTYFDGVTTTVYDANWNVVSSIASTANLTAVQDANGATIGYTYTDQWGMTTTYNSSGLVTGYSYYDGVTTTVYDTNWNMVSSTANTASLTSDGQGGFYSTDAWGTTTTYDATGHVTGYRYSYTDSWNNTTSVTTYDANWNYIGSETRDAQNNVLYSNSYSYDVNGNFTGYTYFDGVTTAVYDANWNLVSSTANTANLTSDGQGGFYSTDAWGTTTTYDATGQVTGYSYSYVDTWNNTTSVTSYDQNWNYIGSETRDASGNLLYSYTYSYDANGVFAGYSYFDGVTTTVYDANWNVVSSTASTANLTLNAAGDGYYATDAWGTTTYYTLAGVKTGSSYSYTNTWDNSVSVSYYNANGNYLSSETKDAQGNLLYSNSYTYDANGVYTGSISTSVNTWDNSVTVSSYNANGYYIGSETRDAQGNLLYSNTYSYDANGNFTGSTSFDGITTTVYDANWIVVSSTANLANLTLNAQGTGYSSTDAWGTTTYYDLSGVKTGSSYSYTNTWDNSVSISHYDASGNYTGSETRDAQGNLMYSNGYNYDANGNYTGSTSVYINNWDGSTTTSQFNANGNQTTSETRDANGVLLYSNGYNYDANGNFTGYTSFDGTTTYTYDANWNLVSAVAQTLGMTQVLDANSVLIGYSSVDAWGTTTYYDLNGVKTGSSYSYTNTWDNSVTVSRYDANGNYISSETRDSQGNLMYSNSYTYDANGVYTGSTSISVNNWDNSVTVSSYNANGNYIGSETRDAQGNLLYSNTYSYDANGNFTGSTSFDGITTTVYDANWQVVSSTVNTASLTQVYAQDGVTVIGYTSSDGNNTTTHYDANGIKTGSSYSYTNTWDNSVSISHYDASGSYIGSETRDAAGNLMYSNINNYDANGVFTGSTSTYTNWDGSTGTSQFNANGNQISSETRNAQGVLLYSNNYSYDANGNFAGYTTFDGTTTWTYDANWNLLSAVVSTANMTPIYETPGNNATPIVGYSNTDQWGTTTYYDLNGVKTGSSYSYTNTWDNSVSTSYSNANGSQIGYETRDAQGNLMYSNHTVFDANGNVTGYTSFDGTTTYTYDANWNLLSAVVDMANMTPIYETPGNSATPIVGYSYTNQWGSTTYYDLNGVETGSSNTWTDPMNGNIYISTFDANHNMVRSENRDSAGNVLEYRTYDYVNGVFTGSAFFDGTTLYTYDANWTLLTDVGPYPISLTLNSDGITMDFSEIAYAPADPAALALTLMKNGTTAMNITSFTGDGTASFTIHTDQTLAAGDWVLLNYNGTTAANGVRDALGNVMVNNAPTGYGGSAEGSSADNVIDLSNATIFSAPAGYDISGGQGNDTIIGSAGFDYIMGGAGADTLTGGAASGDHFAFVQDGTSRISYNGPGSAYVASSGAIDRITDFSSGDELSLIVSDNFAPGGMQQGLGMMGTMPTDGLAADQSFFMVQGSYSAGQFTADAASGTDTMVVYDSDATAGVAQSGIVLSGVTVGQLGAQAGGNYVSYMGGGVTPPPTTPLPADTTAVVTYTFGANGMQTGRIKTDASGNLLETQTNIYDANGMRTGWVRTDASGNTIAQQANIYDANGVEIGVTRTDGLGNLIFTDTYINDWNGYAGFITFDGVTTTVHDANGNLLISGWIDNVDATTGRLVSNIYTDALGNLSSTDTYTYDAMGMQTGMVSTDAVGGLLYTDTFIRDAATGMQTGKVRVDATDTLVFTQTNSYDANGMRTGWVRTDASGNTIAQQTNIYDANGMDIGVTRIDGLGNLIFTDTYINDWNGYAGFITFDGVTTTVHDANGNLLTSGWIDNVDATGRLLSTINTDAQGQVLSVESYTYDANGIQTGWVATNSVPGMSGVPSGIDITPPELIAATISGTDSVTLEFSENVIVDPNAASGSILLNGEGLNIATGMTVTGNVVTVTTNATIGATDYLLMQMGSNVADAAGNVTVSAGQYAAIGGEGNSAIDMSFASWGFYIGGFSGDDVLTGSAQSDDIEGGVGSDTITGNGGQDYIMLGEMVAASDTVVINAGDSTPAGGASDLVYGFDVTSTGAQDMLDLPSIMIAVDTIGFVTGTQSGMIMAHSVSNGMISFSDGTNTFNVVNDQAVWNDAMNYMAANIADGQTVAVKLDLNGDGVYAVDVFQGNATNDILVQIVDPGLVYGLSTTAQNNYVTII